jgi:hypothetical protein
MAPFRVMHAGHLRGSAMTAERILQVAIFGKVARKIAFRRRPIFDQGRSSGRVSNRTSTMRRSHLPPEHWKLQVK